MIKSIKIANVASYSSLPQTFGALKTVNFCFGSNGSGKTTISRIIANPGRYEHCQILWEKGQAQMAMVYNRDFIERNFRPSEEIKGVFTLGTGDDDVLQKITEKKSSADKLQKSIGSLIDDLNGDAGKEVQLTKARKDLETYCWDKIKATYDSTFPDAFVGVNNSKSKLAQKIIELHSQSTGSTRMRGELEDEAKVVFSETSSRIERIPDVDFSKVKESFGASILGQTIIGCSEVDIAGLISVLGISDWVRQGVSHLDRSNGICPFCQQQMPNGLKEKFQSYFNDTFERKMSELDLATTKCQRALADLVSSLEAVQNADCTLLDKQLFSQIKKQIDSKVEIARTRLAQKKAEPSCKVSLPEFTEEVTSVENLISEANKKVEEHNALIDNRKTAKIRLVSEIWNFIINEHKTRLDDLISRKNDLEKAKRGLEANISAKERELEGVQNELNKLEKQRTSVLPTIEAINEMLQSFGFNSFRLAAASQTSYVLQRLDGTNVNDTLSEGERSFVTFLYFYHLLKGGETADSVNAGRIAVFDDPVSSLDADVLFIVSSLVHRCIEDMRNGLGNVKQVIVLTHNVYFHKEVTFDPRRKNGTLKDETFSLIKKDDGISSISMYEDNPIKTSYERLWDEIKNPSASVTSLQNTMRRILEYYFRILGGWKDWNLTPWFEGTELMICQSLLSWVNDGSHFPDDDLHYNVSTEVGEKYREVFKRIFDKTGHIEHYNMMMFNHGTAALNQAS